MDRQTFIGVLLCILLLFFWGPIIDIIWPPPPPKPQTSGSTNQLQSVQVASSQTEAPVPDPLKSGVLSQIGKTEIVPTRIIEIENEFVHLKFTNRGGGIEQITLKKYFDHENKPIILNSQSPVPVLGITNAELELEASYELTQDGNRVIANYQSPKGMLVTKEYVLKEDYQIIANITLKNTGQTAFENQSLRMILGMAAPIDLQSYEWLKKGGQLATDDLIGISFLSSEKAIHENLLGVQKFIRKQQKPYEKTLPLVWVGVKNQYFTILATPTAPFAGIEAEPYELPIAQKDHKHHGLVATVQTSSFDLPSGGSASFDLDLYAGPKEYEKLVTFGKKQDDLLEFGMFKFFAVLLLQLLSVFQNIFGNWGVAIIALTVLVKLVLWPLTAMSTKSMKQMQALAPKMNALKEKYKDEPKKLNEEMMKMYREYRINPAAGCLPIFIQIPIFFAFYVMLRTAIELWGASFLWIHDLSSPDTVAQFMGFNVNLMPLLMAATMIWQTKITPQAPNVDPAMKMMMWFMPATFLLFCYNFSSGLSLYWTAQNLLTILQTYLTKDKPVEPPKKVKSRGFSFSRPLEK